MKLRWTVGTYPIFMYCAICGRTLFYPLSHWLTGTNMCLRCNRRLGSSLRPIKRIRKRLNDIAFYIRIRPKLRKIERYIPQKLCKHHWSFSSVLVHTDSLRPIEMKMVCPKCDKAYVKYTVPYDFSRFRGAEMPTTLWDAIHWHNIEIIAMVFERLRLRQDEQWEVADAIRDYVDQWGYKLGDIKDFTIIKPADRWDKKSERILSPAELEVLCRSVQWQLPKEVKGV